MSIEYKYKNNGVQIDKASLDVYKVITINSLQTVIDILKKQRKKDLKEMRRNRWIAAHPHSYGKWR